MNRINCLIVDDEPIAHRILEGYLSDLPEYCLIAKCLHAMEARTILSNKPIDLMFLDLEMPKLKGFSFLKTLNQPPAVIITTAHREFALEGFDMEVLDYLLKPFSFERFLKAINRFSKLNNKNYDASPQLAKQSFLYFKSERKTIKLLPADILYIEGMSNYVKVHCENKTHVIYSSLSNILERLNADFIRIHKSFIVNKKKITAFSSERIEIQTHIIPVGNTFKDLLKEL